MHKLELVTSRAGLEPLAWRLFPALVPVTQSEWFNIYAMKSPEALTDFLRGTLDNWIEAEIILAWHCDEVSELDEKGAFVSTSGAAEISGHSIETWKSWCQKGEVPGAFKAGERAWMIPRAYVESKMKKGIVMANQLKQTLEKFFESDEFKSGVISSTRASWGGSGYSVELLPDGSFQVLWDNQIGNLYESSGVILKLPALDCDALSEYVDGGGTEEDYLNEGFYLEVEDIKKELRENLAYKTRS